METQGTALVTGATSGLGFEAAAQLAQKGYHVVVTGRSEAKAEGAREALETSTRLEVFTPLAVDLSSNKDVERAIAELSEKDEVISLLILNAGIVGRSQLVKTDEDVEITFSSSLIGHHQFTMQLLADGLLSATAAIIIAGSEAARGDVPTFNPTDLGVLAANEFEGDRVAAAEALIRGDTSAKYRPATAYADAKTFVAWWASQLSDRLPDGMTVNAVSPGSAPYTNADRNANFFMKRVMLPVMKHAPKSMGMAAPVSVAAARYIEVAEYDGVSGKFFASAPKKMTGPIEPMQMPHLHNPEDKKAAWEAVVSVSGGVDFPASAYA